VDGTQNHIRNEYPALLARVARLEKGLAKIVAEVRKPKLPVPAVDED